jgi:hypothetical protein
MMYGQAFGIYSLSEYYRATGQGKAWIRRSRWFNCWNNIAMTANPALHWLPG